MHKEDLLNIINEKYAGKELMFCHYVYTSINFWPERVAFCCSNLADPYNPPIIYTDDLDEFSIEKYLKNIDRAMELNQTDKTVCLGCRLFQKQIVPELKLFNNIKNLTLNNFLTCNSNCIYCDFGPHSQSYFYSALPAIKQLIEEKLIAQDCCFSWGGGEPTIYKEFKEGCTYLIENNYNQLINSTGLKFSQEILNGLSRKTLSLKISPDSGTKETYLKVKGQNGFDRVWKNIKKYCQFPDNVCIKYIFLPNDLNATENEVREFINQCSEANVKNIEISIEWDLITDLIAKNTNQDMILLQKEVKLAGLMRRLARKKDMNVIISHFWGTEFISAILETSRSAAIENGIK